MYFYDDAYELLCTMYLCISFDGVDPVSFESIDLNNIVSCVFV